MRPPARGWRSPGAKKNSFYDYCGSWRWWCTLSAVAYLVLRMPVFGNPNSMGAVMGVVALPVLFWGVLTVEGKIRHRRMVFACLLSAGLLILQPGAGWNIGGRDFMLPDLRRPEALSSADSGTAAVLCAWPLWPLGLIPPNDCIDMPFHRYEDSLVDTSSSTRATRGKACWVRASLRGMKR